MSAENPPKWLALATELRRQIKDGEYAPGDLLPKQADLAAERGIAVSTVARAYAELESQGLVHAKRRKGTVVSDTTRLRRLASNLMTPGEVRGLPADMAQAGIAYSVVATIEDRPAPEHVADLLGVESGTPLLVRDRVQRGDGAVYQRAATWFAPSIADLIPVLREENTGPGGYLQRFEDAGLTLTQRQEAVPDLAAPEECETLQLTRPAAVLRVTRITRDQDERPLEVTEIVMTGRNALIYDV